MKNLFKLTGLALLVTGAMLMCGCGDEKKPEPKKPAPAVTTNNNTQKPAKGEQSEAELTKIAKKPTPENKNPNAPKPLSPLYVYNNSVKEPAHVQYMTPEVIKIFEKEAKHFKLDEGKKWVYSTNVAKPNPNRTSWIHCWIGCLPENHYRKYSVGDKRLFEEHLAYITFYMNPQTNKITRVESFRNDRTEKEGKEGKKTYFTKEAYK